MAIRASDLAFLNLWQDSFPGIPAIDCLGDSEFFLSVDMIELKDHGVALGAIHAWMQPEIFNVLGLHAQSVSCGVILKSRRRSLVVRSVVFAVEALLALVEPRLAVS